MIFRGFGLSDGFWVLTSLIPLARHGRVHSDGVPIDFPTSTLQSPPRSGDS